MSRNRRNRNRDEEPVGGDAAPPVAPPPRLPIASTGMKAWIRFDGAVTGVVTFELDNLHCTNSVANFKFLINAHRDEKGFLARQTFLGPSAPLPPPLVGSHVARVGKDEMVEFGTSPTASYFGGFFKDEQSNAGLKFSNASFGTLSMSNSGPNSNASRFFVTLRSGMKDLDKDHTPFGHAIEGLDVLQKINEVKTDPRRGHAPKDKIIIADCGMVDPLAAFSMTGSAAAAMAREARDSRKNLRDSDDVLNGSYDVVRMRPDDDGTVGDDRIHSTLAMSAALKKRRGEMISSTGDAADGSLTATQIDTTFRIGETMPSTKPSAKQVLAAQTRVFEYNMMEVKEEQKHKRDASSSRKAKAQRVQQATQRRFGKSANAVKTKFY